MHHRVLALWQTSLDHFPFLVILIPAKYPGPDRVQVTKYLAQANVTSVIILFSNALCTSTRASFTTYPILCHLPLTKHLNAMALLSNLLSGSGYKLTDMCSCLANAWLTSCNIF